MKILQRYTIHSKNIKHLLIDLYFSNLTHPLYIFKNERVADFTINTKERNLPLNERKIEETMTFGSCITLSAKNLISGEKNNITANYYLRND